MINYKSNNEIIELLHQVSKINEKYDKLYYESGYNYNIFKIINKESDEVTICKVIYDLLSSNGLHGQGSKYLKLFFQEVLFKKNPELENYEIDFNTISVEREFIIDNNRRIDLVIETKNIFIPIEVKIYAKDQPNQCIDYLEFANKKSKKYQKIYYLTPFGSMPSNISIGTKKENIILLSWKTDIIHWIECCLNDEKTKHIISIKVTLLQLKEIIKNFTNDWGNNKDMEIKELINKSPLKMKSANDIYNVFLKCRTEMIYQLQNSIIKKIKQRKKGIECNDQRSKDKFDIAFYLLETEKKEKIWVRLQENNEQRDKGRLYIGYCISNQNNEYMPVEKSSINKCKYDLSKSSLNYLKWEHIGDDEPNFDLHKLNDNYFDLFEDEYYDKFVDKCANLICQYLDEAEVSYKNTKI